MEYPIAEIFYSVQGEGAQSGIPMVFVRLAGCNVGKPYTSIQRADLGLHIFQNECTIYDGRKFPCDTNYKKSMSLSPEEIVNEIKKCHLVCKWVSITGGEPLMHDLVPLVEHLKVIGYNLHLETSGTIKLDKKIELFLFDWKVVSPKHPYIDEYSDLADEIRILVDEDFKWENLPQSVRYQSDKLWISPVNEAGAITKENADFCLAIQEKYQVRLSLQIHKVLNVR